MRLEIKPVIKKSNIFFIVLILILLLFGFSNKNKNIDKMFLWENGTKLRGVNIWQKRIDPEVDGDFICKGEIGPPFTLNDFMKLRKLGVNYINISHPGIFNVNYPYSLDETIVNNLKKLIKLIAEADMFCVISFRTGPGRSEYTFYHGEDYTSDPVNGWFDKKYYNDRVWENKKLQMKWCEMWKQAALIFKDYENVIGYDLMVEPNSNAVFFDIDNPEIFYKKYRFTLYDWNQFYSEIVKSLRSVDKTTPILISSLNWGDINWLKYMDIIKYNNIVYTVHQYSPHVYTHGLMSYSYPDIFDINYDGINDKFNYNWLKTLIYKVKEFKTKTGTSVAINEYGVVRWVKNAETFLDTEMSLFEEIGVNYAIWEYSTYYEPFRTEIDDFNYFFGTDKNNKNDQYNNILLNILKKYWLKNKIFPSNY